MFVKEDTPLKGAFVLTPSLYRDDRGVFFESFQQKQFDDFVGEHVSFVQENQAHSRLGVLRGLHFQVPPYKQAKLVRVIKGKVRDVIVDVRVGSPTFGQHFSVELSEENCLQLYVPAGFAHGYISLSEQSIFHYKCSSFYAPVAEGGLYFADESLAIDWQYPSEKMIIAEKDKKLPHLQHLNSPFHYLK